MKKAHHKILVHSKDTVERGGSPPHGLPRKSSHCSVKQAAGPTILSSWRMSPGLSPAWVSGSQNWLNMAWTRLDSGQVQRLLQGWDIWQMLIKKVLLWPCLCCFLPCGPWLGFKVSGESIYLTSLIHICLPSWPRPEEKSTERGKIFFSWFQ